MSTGLASLGKVAAAAWGWWAGEIRSCVPRWLSPLLARRGPGLELRVAGGCVSLVEASRGLVRFAATVEDLRDAPSWLASPGIAKLKRDGVRLCLGEGHHLLRSTVLPRAALRRAGAILDLELSRLTPFRREDVVTAWRLGETLADGERTHVHHAIVKRTELISWLETLRGLGLAVRSITLYTEHGCFDGVNLLDGLAEPASRRARRRAGLARAALAIALACLILVPAAILQRHAEASRRLDEEIERHRGRALEVASRFREIESASAAIARLGRRKRELWPLVALIDEVTRIVPDDAWLASLSVEGDELSLSGHARSAARLLGLLEASDLFADVRFTAPVYSDHGEGAERFSLAMRLSPRPAQAAEAP